MCRAAGLDARVGKAIQHAGDVRPVGAVAHAARQRGGFSARGGDRSGREERGGGGGEECWVEGGAVEQDAHNAGARVVLGGAGAAMHPVVQAASWFRRATAVLGIQPYLRAGARGGGESIAELGRAASCGFAPLGHARDRGHVGGV